MSVSGFVPGIAELLCLAVFGLMVAGAFSLLVLVLVRRRPAEGMPPAPRPPQGVPPQRPSYNPIDYDTSVAAVARIAERFCPQCRSPLDRDAPEGLCPACLMAGGLPSQLADPAADGYSPTTPPGGQTALADHDVAQLADAFPQLEILELLGRGGMGAVYKARQRNLDRTVALKVIPPASAADPEFAERFAREARALARLNHPNIVTVYDFGKAGDVYYLLMEYIDGVNLRQTLRAGRLQPEEALAVVPQICDALQYAHDQGVVHRDIKPENVLLDRSGRIKIADFGLAKLLGLAAEDFTLTRTQQVMGTPRYMAPEQIERPSTVDHRADIYSLGVVIYEMLTGELPVGRFPLPSEKSSVDSRIDEIVLRSLEKEPSARYQRASQVKSELATAAAEMGPPVKAWSGPRFPTPSPVYVEPKPPAYDSTLAAPLGQVLVLALGMVAGALMMTVGLVLLGYALAQLSSNPKIFGGLFGGGFGCLIGGAGSLIGSYNSYRQLAGGEDLMRTARITWFDWLMRGYLLLGILFIVASAILATKGVTAHEALVAFIIGAVAVGQGTLFIVLRHVFQTPRQGLDASNPEVRPSLWYAVGIPLLALSLLWILLILDIFYATPRVAPDDLLPRRNAFEFYQRWQMATIVIGGVSILAAGAVLIICRTISARKLTGDAWTVEYPFEHPNWLLGVAAIGLLTVVLPWMRLEHRAYHTLTFQIDGAVYRDVTSQQVAGIVGLPAGHRYLPRSAVAGRIALAVFVSVACGGVALVPLERRSFLRAGAALAVGLVLFGQAMSLLHEMGDQPGVLILDERTSEGIREFSRSNNVSYAPSQWVWPLSEVVTVRPALGLYALIAAGIFATFLGITDLSWNRGIAPGVSEFPIAERGHLAPSKQLLDPREHALAQVRGPANGLLAAGLAGFLPLIISLLLVPTSTVVHQVALPEATGSFLTAVVSMTGASSTAEAAENLARMLRGSIRVAQESYSPEHYSETTSATWAMVPVVMILLINVPQSILLIIGSIKLRKLESYNFAVGTAILACIPCSPAWLISLPMGVWTLVVLQRADVKAAFDQPVP